METDVGRSDDVSVEDEHAHLNASERTDNNLTKRKIFVERSLHRKESVPIRTVFDEAQ